MRMSVMGAVLAMAAVAGCSTDDFSSAAGRTDGGELVVVRSATWVDPDGCEHWVFDTGAEGFMTPKLQPNGRPICNSALARADAPVLSRSFGVVRAGATPQNFVMSTDTTFPSGSATVQPQAIRDLDTFFRFLQQEGRDRIVVEGHTDSEGPEEANLRLSFARAEAVADIAETYGLSAQTRGVGESEPIQPNQTEAGRAANRRVEITVLP